MISEIMAAAGGERPGGNEGATAKLPIEFAGYVNPGPARTPIIKFSDTTIERAKKKAEGWKALCAKYRPLVEAARAQVKVGIIKLRSRFKVQRFNPIRPGTLEP